MWRSATHRYGQDVNELSRTGQFVTPLVVARQRLLRTRAGFECPWSVVGVADVDPEQVDRHKLTAWLATGDRRIRLGDWRPERKLFITTATEPARIHPAACCRSSRG